MAGLGPPGRVTRVQGSCLAPAVTNSGTAMPGQAWWRGLFQYRWQRAAFLALPALRCGVLCPALPCPPLHHSADSRLAAQPPTQPNHPPSSPQPYALATTRAHAASPERPAGCAAYLRTPPPLPGSSPFLGGSQSPPAAHPRSESGTAAQTAADCCSCRVGQRAAITWTQGRVSGALRCVVISGHWQAARRCRQAA